VRAIEHKLDQLALAYPEHGNFVARLRGFVDRFELTHFVATLKSWMAMNSDGKTRDVVLVVDDSPDTLRLLTDALDGAGKT